MVSKDTLTVNIKYRFFVDKFCNWFQDGKPITHRGIYAYNYKHLKIDKPFLVQSVEITQENIILTLNDFSAENLNLKTLYFLNNIPYCSVKNNEFEARFSRPALFQISKIIEVKNDDFSIKNERIKFISP